MSFITETWKEDYLNPKLLQIKLYLLILLDPSLYFLGHSNDFGFPLNLIIIFSLCSNSHGIFIFLDLCEL